MPEITAKTVASLIHDNAKRSPTLTTKVPRSDFLSDIFA
jgi:hypothetical protein